MEKQKLTNPKLSKELKRNFRQFLQSHPPKRVNRNLRKVFLDYIDYTMDTISMDMKDIIWDISSLMELLDTAEEETTDWPEL